MEKVTGIDNGLLARIDLGIEHVPSWPEPGAGRRPHYY